MPEKNIPAFMKAAILLRKKHYRVINPAELDLGEPEKTWEGCLRRDIRELVKCRAVATLPNWTKSKGARLEVHIARELGCPIKPLRHYLQRRKR